MTNTDEPPHGPGFARRAFGGVLLALACFGAPVDVEASLPAMPARAAAAVPAEPAAAATSAATTAKPSGSFLSAELPGDVEHSKGVRETVVGDIEHSTVSAKSGDASLSITASILPGFVTAMATDGILYRRARNELLRAYSARSTSWDGCTYAGLPCRELRYETDDGRKGLARLFLRIDVLVVINAVYDEDEAIARRFLASVR